MKMHRTSQPDPENTLCLITKAKEESAMDPITAPLHIARIPLNLEQVELLLAAIGAAAGNKDVNIDALKARSIPSQAELYRIGPKNPNLDIVKHVIERESKLDAVLLARPTLSDLFKKPLNAKLTLQVSPSGVRWFSRTAMAKIPTSRIRPEHLLGARIWLGDDHTRAESMRALMRLAPERALGYIEHGMSVLDSEDVIQVSHLLSAEDYRPLLNSADRTIRSRTFQVIRGVRAKKNSTGRSRSF